MLEDAVSEYLAGVGVSIAAKRHHVGEPRLRKALQDRGLLRDLDPHYVKSSTTRRATRGLPDEEICQRYLAGETEQSIARSFSVSRSLISARLRAGGIVRRTFAETQKISAARATPEQRKARAAAAHDAVRGRTTTVEARMKLAQTRQDKMMGASANELLLQRWFTDRGIESTPQKAIGTYNADLAFDSTIIEIYGGGWHAYGIHAERASERFRYIFSQGWNAIIVWVDGRRWALSPQIVDYCLDFADYCRQNNLHGHYRIIRGDGKEVIPGTIMYEKAIGLLSPH